MDTSNIWLNRNEEIVQECLEEAFNNGGYRVTNLHKTDRSHENGADLECSNHDERIYIQAKIKPLKKDIEQLERLSKLSADKLIYVYIENPAVTFKEKMDETNNIEFWNINMLHDFLINNNSSIYFRLLFLSSSAVKDISDILEIIASCQEVSPASLKNEQQISKWIVFKDRAVKLHTSLELIYKWLTNELLQKDRIEKNEIERYMNKINDLLTLINQNSSKSLKETVKELKRQNPQLLSKYVIVTSHASNWIGMPYHYKENIKELIENWILPKEDIRSCTFYNLANSYLDNLRDKAEAIEDGVDWVFEDKFKTNIAHT